MRCAHAMPHGAALGADGRTRFALWAPAAREVRVVLEPPGGALAEHALAARANGWFEATLDAPAGTHYRYRVTTEREPQPFDVPDPASRFNPAGVHGPSEVVDPLAFDWGAAEAQWRGRPLHEAVFYELHVGTFTPEGTYAAAARHLHALRELGVTAIELMPLAAFGGHHGWGYDGVLPYAPHAPYGRPDELKAFVQQAHALGLMVFLDVVYNHFGPDGNHLGRYAPGFFTERHHTPWGPAIAFEGEAARPVREFFLHNALFWLGEFRFDGLRLDAVDSILDDSQPHVITELAERVHRTFAQAEPPRQVHLVMENARNPASWLDPGRGAARIDAQWNDDFHHAAHALLTGESEGYYVGFACHARWSPVELLARTLAEGYAYQGEHYPPWNSPRGEPSGALPPTCFAHFLQNHDHIGNRALGERLTALAPPEALDALRAVLLLAPSPPLLFMGEEHGARTPFLYFCDHAGELGRAVREGRRAEFAHFTAFQDPALREHIPDPCATSTFEASRLPWAEFDAPAYRAVWQHTHTLLGLRAEHIVPRLPRIEPGSGRWARLGEHAIEVSWRVAPGLGEPAQRLRLRANLGDTPWPGGPDEAGGEVLYRLRPGGPASSLAAWDVQWSLVPEGGSIDEPVDAEETPLPDLDTARLPRATYRLQLHAGFGFEAARERLPHLAALGVSHLYLSPVLRARAGSTHGYDVVDPGEVNPELGTEAQFHALCDAAHAAGLQVLLDIVPNHMGVLAADNPWWLDVLRHGPASVHAPAFDIDWDSADPLLEGKVLMPVLGAPYGEVLEAGELTLQFDAASGDVVLRYHAHHLPLDPATWAPLLRDGLDTAAALSAPQAAALHTLARELAALPPREARFAARRADAAPRALAQLASLAQREPAVLAWVQARLAALQGRPGEGASFDALDALIGQQAWRLADWRVASDDLNYRRFFNINELAGLRTERPAVFDATHAKVLGWVREGRVDGLRIDHPDGLFDPLGYLRRLQQRQAAAQPGPVQRALYVVVEKILAEHEALPPDWPVHGTTGYDFAAQLGGLFTDGRQMRRLLRIWQHASGDARPFAEVLDEAKRLVLEQVLAAELNRVTDGLLRLARQRRRTRDHTRNRLRSALVELVCAFPVYRTYLDGGPPSQADAQVLRRGAAQARRRARAEDEPALDFIVALLVGEPGEDVGEGDLAERREFIGRFQQLTAPVMAKAMEDTAFYRWFPLLARNEVGSEPAAPALSVAAFHAAMAQRARSHPHSLLATTTHDTKRSEDVRARLHVLSEQPARWRLALQRWQRLNARHRVAHDGHMAPSGRDEVLLYQTLIGLWPAEPLADDAALATLRERVQAAMLKSVREARLRTTWTRPDAAYEAALAGFIDTLLARREPNPFLTDLTRWVQALAPFGRLNSLAMTLLKLTVPGVPDLYQGCETWQHSLVDPDNRRPVDWPAVEALGASLPTPGSRRAAAWLVAQWAQPDGGALKLHLVHRVLGLRRQCPRLFSHGLYRPVRLSGPAAAHAVAFVRTLGADAVLLVAPRFMSTLMGGSAEGLLTTRPWAGTHLADTGVLGVAWHDWLGDAMREAAPRDLAEAWPDLPLGVWSTVAPS